MLLWESSALDLNTSYKLQQGPLKTHKKPFSILHDKAVLPKFNQTIGARTSNKIPVISIRSESQDSGPEFYTHSLLNFVTINKAYKYREASQYH